MPSLPAAAPAAGSGLHDPHGRGDRWLIFAQLVLGVGLIVFGAMLAALTRAAIHDVGMAVIGIGATLMPAGAAASATGRIHQRYSSQLPNAHLQAHAPGAQAGGAGGGAGAAHGA